MQAPSKKQENNLEDGFSSESDRVDEEEIQFSRPASTIQEEDVNNQVKDKLPPPQQIRQQSYSLQPDISTGWSTKIQLPKPIPITYANYNFDPFITKSIKQNNKKAKLLYLGPRYPSTYEAWYQKAFSSPYSHIPTPFKLKVTNRNFCGNRPQTDDCLRFDSQFQSGNLDAAYKIGPKSYELFLRVDSNTRGHFQWYNFKVKNMKKSEKYTFHICNFQKKSSLYTRGAKPYIFSEKKRQNQDIGWQQDGQNIKYQEKLAKVFKIYKYDFYSMFTLSFEYETSYEDDTVQIAYSIPYTYTHLSQFLHRLMQSQKRSYLRMSKLCNTLGSLEVPLLIINETEEQKDKFQKMFTKCVIVSGRAHPGESNGSFMMEGFIKFLCGSSKIAQNLRRNVIFKIVPMLNPDGVVLGNYRTGISGKDFNREFLTPDPKIFPEVFAIKKLVTENKELFKDNFQLFLDFHGHSVKKNVFMYGPEYPIIHRHYYDCRVFPKLLGDHTKMFRFYSCIFKVSEFKNSTARVVLLRKLNIPFSYTIQASNSSYYDSQMLKDVPFNETSLSLVGQKIGETMEQYIEIILKLDKARYEKLKNKKPQKHKYLQNKRSSYQYYNQHNIQRQKQKNEMGQLEKILSMEDETIINLFAQIEKLEQGRKLQNQKYSQGEISEGSSDGQGEEDDLEEEKLGFFYDLLKKKNTKNTTYDSQDVAKFFAEKKELNKNDPRFKKFHKKNQSSVVIQLDKHSKRQSQLLSKIKVNERKSFVFRNKPKYKKEESVQGRSKMQSPRVVSFGTGYIGFDSSAPQEQQQKMDRLNMDIISESFKSKLQTGFLPNRLIDTDRMRQTYILNKKNRSFDLGETYIRESSLNKMKNKPKQQSFRMKMII